MAAALTATGVRLREPRLRREAGVLLIAVALGFGLRVLGLNAQPLWWDEGYSVWFATHPLGSLVALTADDIHPPLYYILLRGWSLLLGTAPPALRLLSVIFGTLAIPMAFAIGRHLFSRRTGVLAAFLLAINPLAIFYSQEVRMYGLVALLSAGSLLAAWRALDARIASPRPAWQRVIPYILLATAALYTQYYAVFLPIGLTAYAGWRWLQARRKGAAYRPVAAAWLGAQAAVALFYLPWVLYAVPRLVPYVSQKVIQDADRPLGLPGYFGRHLSAFLAGHLEGPLSPYWPLPLLLLIPLAAGLLWAGGLWASRREAGSRSTPSAGPAPGPKRSAGPDVPGRQSAVVMLLSVLLVALVLGWLIGLRYPFFPDRGERLLLLALPAFLVLAAASLEGLLARARVAGYATAALAGAVCAASLVAFYTVPRYADDDYRPLLARIVEQGLPGDTLLAVYPWQVGYWRAYGDEHGAEAILLPEAAWGPPAVSAVDTALARGRVWFPAHLALGALLETRVEDHLRTRAVTFVNEWHGPHTRLSAWAAASAEPPIDLAPARFWLPGSGAGSVELAGVAARLDPVPAANAVLAVALRWRADAPPPALGVTVRLSDAIGQHWAQRDYEPLGSLGLPAGGEDASCTDCPDLPVAGEEAARPWLAEDHLGILIPAGTPPGRYRVELLVRPKGSERPLNAVSASGESLGASVRLFDITVVPADRLLGAERLPIACRRTVEMGDGLRFLGYSADRTPATPGDERKMSLFWQAQVRPSAEYVAFVQLLDRQGRVVAGWEAPPGASYHTREWAPGTLIRTQAALRIPASLADGRYRLIAGLFRAADKARLHTAQGRDHIALGEVTVQGRAHRMAPPTPSQAADARLGDLARLVGYDLVQPEAGVPPGGSVSLTLYWQALGSADRPYTVFVHLLDRAGAIRGYGDSEPGAGSLPTTGWLPGEYLADTHQVILDSGAPPGEYRVAVGMWDPASGERLSTPDGADEIVLEAVVRVVGG